MTATNELVVDEAGSSAGRTILLFANRRHLVLHHLGEAGLQAVAARNEDVHVLQIAGAPALRTVSWRIPENYFMLLFISNTLVLDLASLVCFLRGET